jgi:phosphopantothenate synthetase
MNNEESKISHEIESRKTDTSKVENVVQNFDLDEELEQQFQNFDERLRQLEIKYTALLNTRKYLTNGYKTY